MRICTCILFFIILSITDSIDAKNFVIINKIMYDSPLNEQIATGVAYSNGEYVELYNAGIETVNLNGWVLRGGGSTEIYYFPVNTTMGPKTYLIVAYQYYNSGFTLDQLYSGITATADCQIQYQRKIILSNSGEPVYLRDNYGMTKDSIYYDGTSNKTKPNRLSADNTDGLEGNSCVCVQRKTTIFKDDGCAIPNNLEWVTAVVNPFQQNTSFTQPFLPGVGISYAYDLAGNRISRKLVYLDSNPTHVKQVFSDSIPEPSEEKLGNRIIKLYPNPTKGVLAVEIRGGNPDEGIRMILYSSQGTMLQDKTYEPEITTIEMSSYPTGWYILRVIAGDKKTEYKIIKQ